VTDRKVLEREIKGLLKFAGRYKIKTRLVSLYPVKELPETIEGNLAHRFLSNA